MRLKEGLCLVATVVLLTAVMTSRERTNPRDEIETLNKHYVELHHLNGERIAEALSNKD
jgi:hypothetical protein